MGNMSQGQVSDIFSNITKMKYLDADSSFPEGEHKD